MPYPAVHRTPILRSRGANSLTSPRSLQALPRQSAGGREPVVFLTPAPAFAAKEAEHAGVDRMLAGHTHGGQTRLPFFGTPHSTPPRGGRRFLEGRFDLGPLQLYVSRGVGTVKLPARFCCRPELTLLTLHPAQI